MTSSTRTVEGHPLKHYNSPRVRALTNLFKRLCTSMAESTSGWTMLELVSYNQNTYLSNGADLWAAGAVGFFWDLSDEDFDAAMWADLVTTNNLLCTTNTDNLCTNSDINLKGTFRCMRAAAIQMMKQDPLSSGNRGTIINIGSVFGTRGSPASTSYSASKAGIVGLMRAAVMELSSHKITVNAICPGFVATNMTSGLPDEVRQMLKNKHPLGFGESKDIAGPAVLLASDEGRWIQGAEFFVDGGYIVWWYTNEYRLMEWRLCSVFVGCSDISLFVSQIYCSPNAL